MICLCLTARDEAHNRLLISHYREATDLLEYRVDLFSSQAQGSSAAFAASIHASTGLQGLLTIRTREDGGAWEGTEEERQALYLSILDQAPAGTFAWVDLEHDRSWPGIEDMAGKKGTRLIRSAHDFTGVPGQESLKGLLLSMARAGAVPKFAGFCRNTRDLLTLVSLGLELSASNLIPQGYILLGMGPFGMSTRILAPRLGSLLTYCSANPHDLEALGIPATGPAAPGHLSPRELKVTYGYHRLNRSSKVYGVLGNPVLHSRSPAFHNPLLQKAGINGVYVPFQVDDLAAFRTIAELLDASGFSVTIPHKEEVRTWLQGESRAVASTGACNTVCRKAQGWYGENTDVRGFLEPLLRQLEEEKKTLDGLMVLVIGAGGAARAVLFALLEQGARVLLANRTQARALELAQELTESMGLAPGRLTVSSLDGEAVAHAREAFDAQGFDVVVNTTSLGMAHSGTEDQDPAAFLAWQGTELAYDIIYTPAETTFLRRAAHAGARTLNGSSMFDIQARCQSELWGVTKGA